MNESSYKARTLNTNRHAILAASIRAWRGAVIQTKAHKTMKNVRKQFWFALIVVWAHPSWAETEIKCNPAGNQLELNACAFNDFAKADAELNNVYQQLVKKMAGDPKFIKKLHAAEKAWIVFRDADLSARFACAEEDARQCWGSIYPMSFFGRKTELTKTRVKQLRELLEDGIGQ